jgi:hypothetical protein
LRAPFPHPTKRWRPPPPVITSTRRAAAAFRLELKVKSGHKPIAKSGDQSRSRPTDLKVPPGHRLRRLQSGRRTFGAASALPNPARGEGLRLERDTKASRGARRDPQHPTQSQSQVEETASRRSSIERATPSNACSAVGRTSGVWRRAMTETPPTSSPQFASPQPSATGYESTP